MQGLAARADARLEMLAHSIGDEELRILRPAVMTLGQLDFLRAQRFSMRRARILLVRGAVGDVAVDDDESRSIGRLLERPERALEHLQVVGIAHARHVPAVAEKPRRHVVAVRQRRVALDRDVIVVVDPAQVAELEVPGERGGLAGDPFHHAAVAAERVDVVVEEIESGAIEVAGQPAFGDGHADAGRHALSQWAAWSSRRQTSSGIRGGRGIGCQVVETA